MVVGPVAQHLNTSFLLPQVDLTALGELEVKEGFAKYGAKAVFDKEKKLLYIYVCAWGKNVYPPKEGTENSMEEWNYAKWVSETLPDYHNL